VISALLVSTHHFKNGVKCHKCIPTRQFLVQWVLNFLDQHNSIDLLISYLRFLLLCYWNKYFFFLYRRKLVITHNKYTSSLIIITEFSFSILKYLNESNTNLLLLVPFHLHFLGNSLLLMGVSCDLMCSFRSYIKFPRVLRRL
jgi:hypothetical protein